MSLKKLYYIPSTGELFWIRGGCAFIFSEVKQMVKEFAEAAAVDMDDVLFREINSIANSRSNRNQEVYWIIVKDTSKLPKQVTVLSKYNYMVEVLGR